MAAAGRQSGKSQMRGDLAPPIGVPHVGRYVIRSSGVRMTRQPTGGAAQTALIGPDGRSTDFHFYNLILQLPWSPNRSGPTFRP